MRYQTHPLFLFIQHLVRRMLALEFRYDLLHFLHHLHGIVAEAQLVQLILFALGIRISILTYSRNLDFRMMGRLRYL